MVEILVWILFGSVIILALPLQLAGLPGTWLLVADAALLRWIMGPGSLSDETVATLAFMALLAEGLEFLSAVKGARTGPPLKGAVSASIAGAIAGGLLGAPVLFGLGAIPGMAAGAWLAVFLLAFARGRKAGDAAASAHEAMIGRLKGTALKLIVGTAMVAVMIASLVM